MSSLKNFMIWLGWIKYRNPYLLFAFFFAFFFIFFGIRLLIRLLTPTNLPLIIGSIELTPTIFGVGFLILGLIIFIFIPLAFMMTPLSAKKNWRIAVDEAKKIFGPLPPLYKIFALIRKAETTKDGAELTEFLKNWNALAAKKKELEKLTKDLEKLPEELRGKIQKTRLEIAILESKL